MKRKRRIYESVKAGEWIQPTRKGYRLRCCDCGLVHIMDFYLLRYAGGARSKIKFRVFRDNRATAAIRAIKRKKP